MLYLQFLLPLLPLLEVVSANPIVKRLSNQLLVSGRDGSCLHPTNFQNLGNGVQLTTIDCKAVTFGWDIEKGSGSVRISGTNLVLDAGTQPGNNGLLKLWQSYPGLYQQTWYFTDDNRIAITGGDQCLDQGSDGPQTYQCTPLNTKQIWYAIPRGGDTTPSPPTSSSAQPPPPASTGVLPSFPRGTVYADPTTGGQRLHPYGRDDLCVSVQGGSAQVGSILEIAYCAPNNDPKTQLQLFGFGPGRVSTRIPLTSNPNLCVDAGVNPSSGVALKLWSCLDNVEQQLWYQRDPDGKIGTAPNQCFDVAENGGGRLQTWQCYDGNNNQNFHGYYP